MKAFQKGFTLIELMITLAIVAILATIAYPAYNDYVIKSNRVEAKRTLLTAAQFLERRYSTQNTYLQNTSTSSPPVALPAEMACAPSPACTSGQNVTHTIAYSTTNALNATNFTLVATAVGTQLTAENRLGCVAYTLDNFGQRRAYSDANATTLNTRCW